MSLPKAGSGAAVAAPLPAYDKPALEDLLPLKAGTLVGVPREPGFAYRPREHEGSLVLRCAGRLDVFGDLVVAGLALLEGLLVAGELDELLRRREGEGGGIEPFDELLSHRRFFPPLHWRNKSSHISMGKKEGPLSFGIQCHQPPAW